MVLLTKSTQAGGSLWLVGSALWVLLLYGILAVQIVHEGKPTVEHGLNGAWLLTTVATQSVAVLGTLLAGHLETWRKPILFASFGCFMIGGLLYLLIITLLLYRLLFYAVPAEALTPPYWIDMGAEAISTLAGANLILHAGKWTLLQDLLPFLKGLTLVFWATATWWIPLLLLLGLWRHVYKQVPFRYSTQYWSLVFPLGMYAVCTFQLGHALPMLPIAPVMPALFFYLALTAWAITFWGFISTHVIRRAPTLIPSSTRG